MTGEKGSLSLIIGGAGSGKSEYAEKLAVTLSEESGSPRIYLATMLPEGEEAAARIRRHQQNRDGRGFRTLERGADLAGLPEEEIRGAAVLLEDLGNLLGNEMFGQQAEDPKNAVLRGIGHLREHCRDLVIVTNEIFSDGVQYTGDMLTYLQTLGEISCILAENADLVAEVVCGIPLIRKG